MEPWLVDTDVPAARDDADVATKGDDRRARMMERMEERWRRRQEGNGGMPGPTRS